jgi:hypothetical protein
MRGLIYVELMVQVGHITFRSRVGCFPSVTGSLIAPTFERRITTPPQGMV